MRFFNTHSATVLGMSLVIACSGEAASAPSDVQDQAQYALARSAVEPDTTPDIAEADYTACISQLSSVGLALGQQLTASHNLTSTNHVYSPLSASFALSMAYAGARGDTAAELKRVLGDVWPEGTFHSAMNRLARELASRVTSRTDARGTAHEVALSLADALFVERSLTLQPDFLDLLSREYDSGVHQLDFKGAPQPARAAINAWVAQKTEDQIQELLPEESLNALTRLVLVNALYLHATWASAFAPWETQAGTFHAPSADVQTPFMNDERLSAYRSTTDYAVAELPYEGGELRMTIVLPHADKLDVVRSQVSGAWLSEAVRDLADTNVHISLPKFKVTSESLSLVPTLEAMGLAALFTGAADLSGITTQEKLMVADVLHQAHIAVDEQGTVASAATAVVARTDAALADPQAFVVDRPFLFFIRDHSGAVLFAGQVIDPTL
ncbi:MAG: serpin family protein [Polyangiales bacterium]